MEEKKVQGKIGEKVEVKPEEKKIKVERETYTKDDKTYFSYFIKGVIRDRRHRVIGIRNDDHLCPPGNIFGDAVKINQKIIFLF